MNFIFKTFGPSDKLEPQTVEFLKSIPEGDGTPVKEQNPAIIRSKPRSAFHLAFKAEIVAVEEISFPTRDGSSRIARIYRPNATTTSAPLIYFHGGCWFLGSLDTHDAVCRYLCKHSGMTVISIDYRLAPEFKFPTGLNDCYDGTKWLLNNRDKIKLTNDEPILCGDSAGANLAIATALAACRSNEFSVKAQILFYPIADISKKFKSYSQFSKNYYLTEELMDCGIEYYINDANDRKNSLISPVLANDLHLLPKTLLQTAEFDVLRDEGENLGEMLYQAGVDVECTRYNGTVHGYVALAGKLDIGKQALNDAINFIKSLK